MTKTKTTPLDDQLREAIRASEKTLRELEAETGIGYQNISAFLRGRGLTLALAGKLTEALGLELAKRR